MIDFKSDGASSRKIRTLDANGFHSQTSPIPGLDNRHSYAKDKRRGLYFVFGSIRQNKSLSEGDTFSNGSDIPATRIQPKSVGRYRAAPGLVLCLAKVFLLAD